MKISAILLGAGESKRMGFDKLSLPYGKKTILEHCLDVLLRSKVKEVVVVLSNRTKGMESRIRGPRVKIVINPYYKKGMSTSLRWGIQAIDPATQGILIALGDQPSLKTRTVDALIRAFVKRKGKIILPTFRSQKGNPVIFDKKFEEELLRLEGDRGGKSIVEKHRQDVRRVSVKSEGVVKDIDTWKDYKKEFKIDLKRERVQKG
jgi:molybdenum cofactor cytidylyltransferase